MLSHEQARSISRTVHLLRPAWNEEGIFAALSKVRDRNPFEVALAAIRAAVDPNVRTPGVIPRPGPHWNELEPTLPPEPRLTRDEICASCGASNTRCRQFNDHPFKSLNQAAAGRVEPPEGLHELIEPTVTFGGDQ